MNLYLIIFQDGPFREKTVREKHSELFDEIEKFFDLHLVAVDNTDSIPKDEYRMALIASTHSEVLMTKYFDILPYPIHLLCDGRDGSLSAAIEITAWVKSKGLRVHLIHGRVEHMVKLIIDHHAAFAAQREIRGKRVGVMGFAPPWAIASDVDYLVSRQRVGIEFVEIRPQLLVEAYESINDKDVIPGTARLAINAESCREGMPHDIGLGIKLYLAFKKVITEMELDAVTFQSEPLMKRFSLTGSVAASLLNDNGIPATADGDLQTIVSVLVARILTDRPSFKANISFVDEQENTIIVSSSSIATCMPEKFALKPSPRSDRGVTIKGSMLEGQEVTIMRMGAPCLDEFFVSRGVITRNTDIEGIGHTQFEIKMEHSVRYFLKQPLGNHHVVIVGNHEKVIREFMLLYSATDVTMQ